MFCCLHGPSLSLCTTDDGIIHIFLRFKPEDVWSVSIFPFYEIIDDQISDASHLDLENMTLTKLVGGQAGKAEKYQIEHV